MFIIRMVVLKKLIIKRIRKKDKERLEEHPEDIQRWFREYKEFNKKVKADFMFRNDYDLKKLFLKVDQTLEKIE